MSKADDIYIGNFQKALLKARKGSVIELDESIISKSNFQVQRFENVVKNAARSIPPNRWSHYRIALISQGSGEFLSGLYNFHAKKNTLVVLPGRILTSSKNWSLDMKGYVAVFNSDFFVQNNFPYQHLENKKILTSAIQPYVHLTDENAKEIESIFEKLLSLNQLQEARNEALLVVKLLELLILSEEFFDEQLHFDENLPVADIIKRYNSLVDANFIQERKVSFYAKELNVHPNYLNTLIKEQTGKTAKESIQSRVITEIKYLLHSTNMSIKEIAHHLGFNDSNYLTSFFTKSETVSPSKYRSSFI